MVKWCSPIDANSGIAIVVGNKNTPTEGMRSIIARDDGRCIVMRDKHPHRRLPI